MNRTSLGITSCVTTGVQSSTHPSTATSFRDGLHLEFSNDNVKRSRIVSLSDLALDALSPIYSMASRDVKPIISSGSLMTPTPTQFLFPQSVTAEQEAYATGFVQALEEIYEKQGRPYNQQEQVAFDITGGADSNPSSVNSATNVWLPSSSQAATAHYIPLSTASSVVDYRPAVLSNKPGISAQHLVSVSSGAISSVAPVNAINTLMSASYGSDFAVGRSVNTSTDVRNVQVGEPSFSQLQSLKTSCSVVNSCIGSSVLSHSRGLELDSLRSSPLSAASTLTNADTFRCGSSHSTLAFSSGYGDVTVDSESNSSIADASSSVQQMTSSQQLPVNMVEQDRLRLERKRAKNRVAAARCQMRKLERITKLEDKARDLRNYNAQLSQTASTLRQHVSNLRKQILTHTERGCRLLVPALQ